MVAPQNKFISGIEISRAFYQECIRPLIDTHFSNLPYAAALIGPGSEVLGFDDSMSTDHHWGPRAFLFLTPTNFLKYADKLKNILASQLPYTFMGYATNFTPPNPDDSHVQQLKPINSGPINHRVEIFTIRNYLLNYLGFDINNIIEIADWLTFPQQQLLTLTTGAVFHDEIGLTQVRERLAFYPHDIWLYLMAACWTRIAQEEHLMGRAGLVGDEIGSALLGSRLVRDVMRLGFLMERKYAPYPKWFGTAFKNLACAPELWPTLLQTLQAQSWQDREQHLCQAYALIAAKHNALQLTPPLPQEAIDFHGRPFKVIAIHGFAAALVAKIQDPGVKKLATHPIIGSIDLISDNTDILETISYRQRLQYLYR